jgi:hypothetical protein
MDIDEINAKLRTEYESAREEFDIGYYVVALAIVFLLIHISGIRNQPIDKQN